MPGLKKVSGINQADKKIIIDHVTIRVSIFFLLLKLIFLETISSIFVIFLESVNYSVQSFDRFNIPLFILIIFVKMIITIFIILSWLEEYYEINTTEIKHKKGIFFEKEEKNLLEHISLIKLNQGFLGRIFNYGTLELHNWRNRRNYSMYLIHNPKRYYNILDSLLAYPDKEKEVFRETVLEYADEEEDND